MSDMIDRLNTALEGRYRIDRELGAGGMATVYLAEDVRHKRQVALKVLRPELAAVVGAERFLTEIETTANLQHPHILPLFDSGEAESFLFYVMPYVEGASIREKLDQEKQLRVDDAVALTRKVADALDYAHEKGVVHRDIKPANILLSERGEPLVADFGIALAVSQAGGGRITETGLSLGTPHYMSPEQATGDRDVDPRSDVYALGCVLYEMLAGQPPFAAPTAQGVLARILTEEPRQVTELRRTVPAHVAAVIARALEKLPADRFESAAEFLEALDDQGFTHESRVTPAVVPAPSAAPSGAQPSARRWAVPLLTTALAIALVAAAWGWLGRADAPELPVTRTSIAAQTLGFGRLVAISPDGSTLAWIGPNATAGNTQILVRASDDPTLRALPGTEGALAPSFSPDGRWIAFVGPDGVQKVSVNGGTPLTLVSGGTYFPHQWTPSDEIMLDGGGAIARVSASGGTPEVLLAPTDSVSYGRPYMLPGQAGVLLEINRTGTEATAVGVLDLETGEIGTVATEGYSPRYIASGHVIFGLLDDVLFAVPFDADALEVQGTPSPVLDQVAVFGGGAVQLDVSDNGVAVYSARTEAGSARLVLVDSVGTVETLPLEPRSVQHPRFSPDGDRIAFQEDNNAFVYDVTLGTTTRLTFEGTNFYPIWSPDGAAITFGSNRGDTDASDVFRVPVNGSEPPQKLLTRPQDQYPQAWAPDGTRLLVRHNHPARGRDLLTLRFDGEGEPQVEPYLTAEWDETRPHISPDGRWVAYQSNEAGPNNVYVRAFPTPRGKWQISQEIGTEPRWSPDGSTLYYRTSGGLVAARVETGAGFRVVARDNLFPVPFATHPWETQYDVHPSGDHFVFIDAGTGGGEEGELLVVTNWFREIRERLGEDRGAK